ncbi:helix-turn-helix transcriptional regulator [Paludibacterium sp.]|uniref:helix-turn-helix transcriptional regulator n=1 Tax=Paludibacterium sp. TaxID=1917523 RepID=UPI0025F59F6F|nr:helix-turn-helix transcriptional regulator [Paludibacterium sp.]MBV8647247.1 helix-turn-helix domain-containing protein [Paludibacterium sp.]
MSFAIMTATELGLAVRKTRQSLGKSQSWLAEQIGCRRQTIGDLEAGRNVEIYTLLSILSALGKGLQIVDILPDLDNLEALFSHE